MLIRLTLLLVALGFTCAYETYTGYQVLTSSPVSRDLLAPLRKLENDPRFDFWQRPRVGSPLKVMSSPDYVADLYTALDSLGLKPKTYISDLGKWVAADRKEWEEIKRTEKRSAREVTFDRYMELDEIFDYLDELAATYPDLVTLEDAGTSYEGRPLRMIKISNGPGKQAIFIDSNFHAREYIGIPFALKAIYELVENYTYVTNKALVDEYDWYILPSVNPDGYVYTFTGGRMWRKTRKPNEGSDCVGTDPNRNFDFHWGEDGDIDFCSQSYHGTNAFSEPEAAAVGKMLREKGQAGELVVYMTTHAFGSFLLHVWGYTYELPPNADQLLAAGTDAADAIRSYNGTEYVVGSASNVYFPSFGSADDYAYGVGNIPYSYTWELQEGGITGFDPPNSDIDIIASETWEGAKALVRYVALQGKK